MIVNLDLSAADRLGFARRQCAIATESCDDLAHLLVRDEQEEEAVEVYERWIAGERDAINVAGEVGWLVRYYAEAGHLARAEDLASRTEATFSHSGLRIHALLMDRLGRYAEAEQTYQTIARRYDDSVPLGAFKVRSALRTGDKALELEGWELMRAEFPTGLKEVKMHALDVPPRDGVAFGDFGRRAQSAGLRRSDIVVGVDGWRVRSWQQMRTITSLSHDAAITYTVWRDGQYRHVKARVPERWLALSLHTYEGERVVRR